MKRLILGVALTCAASAMAAGAQQPGRPMGPGPVPGRGAQGRGGGGAVDDPAHFLLAHTGEFKLTDAQVTRLAAIARRGAERRQALRTQMDSMRFQRGPGGGRPDSTARAQMRQRFDQMRPAMDRMRQQSLADRRDAIAVLTPDQQAQAWERIAAAGQRRGFGRGGRGFGGGRNGFRGGRMPGMRMRDRGGPRRMGSPNNDDAGADRRGRGLQRRPDDQLQDQHSRDQLP